MNSETEASGTFGAAGQQTAAPGISADAQVADLRYNSHRFI
jgi:hypothetical protein